MAWKIRYCGIVEIGVPSVAHFANALYKYVALSLHPNIPNGLMVMISACQTGKSRETRVRFPVEEKFVFALFQDGFFVVLIGP